MPSTELPDVFDKVYTSNAQLGGPQIMYANGVSHQTVKDDYQGVLAVLHWLSYVPAQKQLGLPIYRWNIGSDGKVTAPDPVDREIAFDLPKGGYNPRHMLAGKEDREYDTWHSGFFDRGSFVETLGGWANTVVTGRARLGGIPCGVIAVETRTVEGTMVSWTDSKEGWPAYNPHTVPLDCPPGYDFGLQWQFRPILRILPRTRGRRCKQGRFGIQILPTRRRRLFKILTKRGCPCSFSLTGEGFPAACGTCMMRSSSLAP